MRPTPLFSRLLKGSIASSPRPCSPLAHVRPTTSTGPGPGPGRGPRTRALTSSPALCKKGGKAAREASRADASGGGGGGGPKSGNKSDNNNSSGGGGAADDPHDFGQLESDIAASVEGLKGALSKLRSGGRFNPEVLEALRVHLPAGGNKQGAAVALGDVAQVVPKGRVVCVVVGEEDHVKPITSAIQASNLSLTPQPDAHSPLTLNVPIPPPTAESRKAVVDAAAKAGDQANNAVRNARQTQQKKLRAMQLAKSARPDDLKKAGQQMEKLVEKGQAEVKRVVDGARKALDS